MRKSLCVVLSVVALLVLSSTATAVVPRCMNVQGCLTDGAGDPVAPGLKIFTFRIFNQSVGGAEIWPGGPGEQHTLATDDAGLWNAVVGSLIPLTDVVFVDSTRWLQVTVDDGVLPPETLPRIKLNTIPYTYSSSISGNAFALEGFGVGDLRVLFMDVAGDTANGFVTVNKPNKAGVGSSFRVNNLSDGHTPSMFMNNTLGIVAEAAANGIDAKYGIVGIADGSAGVKCGTYGTASGGGDVNIGLYGLIPGSATAPDNYAGYFYGGDVIVLATRNTGDDGVVLPSNSISAGEILNEPGISNSLQSWYWSAAEGVVTVVDSVEVDLPAPGYVEVEGQLSWINVTHTTGTTTELRCSIDKVRGSTDLSDGGQVVRWPAGHPSSSGSLAVPMQASRVYFETAGHHKYYLQLYYRYGTDASVDIGRPYIRARYFPTLYGSLSVTEANGGNDTGPDATLTPSAAKAATNLRVITKQEHDARLEAEMEALRERLREVEASLSAIRGTATAREQ